MHCPVAPSPPPPPPLPQILYYSCCADRGKLFTWGLGLNGRLGLGSEGDVLEPTLMDFDFGGKPLVQIVCGLDHTLAITED